MFDAGWERGITVGDGLRTWEVDVVGGHVDVGE